jgi:NitT/TauT family transport system ATP-binding protein
MIALRDISKSYGGRPVFSGFSADFEARRVSCILGASGVGKTTLINIIAGLVPPDRGTVRFGVTGERPRASYVFQEHRLLPWLNVYDNLDLVLRGLRKTQAAQPGAARFVREKPLYTKAERAAVIREQLALVGLSEYETARLNELSGGMARRAALCRAFLYPSELMFLDEPFKELDSKLKDELYESFFRAYENAAERRTVFFVTHDISEALRLADTIFVLSGAPAAVAGRFDRSEFTAAAAAKIKALL